VSSSPATPTTLRSAGESASIAARALLRWFTSGKAAFYLAAVGLFLLFRVGSFVYTAVRVTDTPTYEEVSRASLLSGDFWAGGRPFTVPLVWKVFSSDEARIAAHLTLSIVAWLVLAAVVALCLRDAVAEKIAFGLVLLFGATTEVILWDPLLLSESVSLSLTALLVAAWLVVARRPTWIAVAGVLATTLFWTFARDSHAYLLLFVALLVALSLIDPAARPQKVVLAGASVVIAALSIASANEGLRWYQPMRDILLNRVDVDADMEAYFAQRLGPQWRDADARRVYARYLVTHPGYTLGDPFFGSQTTPFSSADNARALLDPDFRIYNDNAADRSLPLPRALDDLVYVHGKVIVVALALLAAAAAVVVARIYGLPPPVLVAAALVVSTIPHSLAVYHLSGLEVDRHALEVAVLLRLGIFLLALFALDSFLRVRRAGPGTSADAA
jgi:hypothetical protein